MQFQSDNYELLEKIGQGGFGEVYKARQISTNQLVAIKFLTLSADFDEETKKRYVDRFERETLLGSKLQHPNIVRLLDKGRSGENLLFAVFEYVNGKTLKDVLSSGGAMVPTAAAEIMAQVLDALVHAHQQGVIHRDIKPANIMLNNAGAKTHAMVLDFGIGTLVNEVRQLDYKSLTLTREVLGTPSYSAPEQLRGEPPTLKTDLYVWGLVFIECLIGKPTISGSSLASIFHQQLSPSNVPIPASIVGHPVAGLLRRVLNKKASERAGSAAMLYRELAQINFSSLVGDLAGQKPQGVVSNGEDETLELVASGIYRSKLTERKQITILSVLLSIRTDDSHALQPELIDTLLSDQKNQCQDTAIRYGAYHVGTLGDNLLFYFGYPGASENDTRFGARTALDIVSNLKRRNALLKAGQGIEFLIRIGMHTGFVTCYADALPEGSTPNIAMGLSRSAEFNQILCSDSTRKLLDTYIEFESVASRGNETEVIKIPRFSLLAERQLEAFGFLRGTQKNRPFFGRDPELSTLKNIIGTSDQSQTKLAHVSGEAGIGKSRLVFELRNAARNMSHQVAQCLPEYQNNALYPILNLLRYQYSLDSLTPAELQERLSQAVHQPGVLTNEVGGPGNNERLAILLVWLNLVLPDNLTASTLPPEHQKKVLFSTLNGLLIHHRSDASQAGDHAQAGQRKLFIFEDMHWADPTSLEFLAQFVRSLAFVESKDVLISTSRQALPGVLNGLGFKEVSLAKLAPEATSQFISALFDNVTVAPRVLDVLVTRTDGIPLFIEELVNMLKQKNLVRTIAKRVDFVSQDKLQEVPGSLRDSLQQKLDSLVYAKTTAQLAATIGREFDYDLLVAASNQGESHIQNSLTELIESGLIFQHRKVGGDSYIFKHALVRDAAYESIVGVSKQNFHKAIATTLEEKFSAQAAANPGLMAHHFADAQEYESAVNYGIKLSKQQIKQSSNLDALDSVAKNLEWSGQVADKSSRITLLLSSYEVSLPVVLTTKGYGAEELIDVINNIESLVLEWRAQEGLVDLHRWDDLSDRSKWAQFLSFHYRSERKQARELGELLLVNARANGDKKKMMAILSHLAQTRVTDGDFNAALREFNESIQIFDEINDENAALEYGIHVKAQSMAMGSVSYYYLGQVDKGLSVAIQSIEYAEELKHDMSIVFAYMFTGFYYSNLENNAKVIEWVNRYYQKHGKTRSEVWHTIYIDLLYCCAIRDIPGAEKHLADIIASGQGFASMFYSPFLANAYCSEGAYDKAVALLGVSLQTATQYQAVGSYPVLYTMMANCLYRQTGSYSPQVENHLKSAIDYSREQGAAYLELNALSDSYILAGSRENTAVTDRIRELLGEDRVDSDSPAYVKALGIIGCL